MVGCSHGDTQIRFHCPHFEKRLLRIWIRSRTTQRSEILFFEAAMSQLDRFRKMCSEIELVIAKYIAVPAEEQESEERKKQRTNGQQSEEPEGKEHDCEGQDCEAEFEKASTGASEMESEADGELDYGDRMRPLDIQAIPDFYDNKFTSKILN